ncbi:MAG: hypothetical protein A3C84_02800 [Candidatus Ryanbacteria bacterium RIFCSPHIGHO2_02_FULL_48_12]|uniref:Uncharacterized protein n=1 Tax=Candidatus Ryanbacteria bacterium RIFCSPHIGHO2_01_FULL_48_27 TaxID=1802115 RepID=A0A1G2G4Q5_9BACT|nr:MAG: hypothetical protein A2756_01265 [Candidatus Ryanbacteria bacterium RIFCSPHIGHO2_01_FULL_48_27]OGZ49034.1 MAG: hypothetical protein A3C84_02800 [Candidatus Ryanbacteria bacterium RIFCSPHIGHO2_02_FULL_48_12]
MLEDKFCLNEKCMCRRGGKFCSECKADLITVPGSVLTAEQKNQLLIIARMELRDANDLCRGAKPAWHSATMACTACARRNTEHFQFHDAVLEIPVSKGVSGEEKNREKVTPLRRSS